MKMFGRPDMCFRESLTSPVDVDKLQAIVISFPGVHYILGLGRFQSPVDAKAGRLISSPTGNRPPNVLPTASLYTDS
jgi:hypothetical protein